MIALHVFESNSVRRVTCAFALSERTLRGSTHPLKQIRCMLDLIDLSCGAYASSFSHIVF